MDKRMITFLHISEASDYYDIFSEYVELLYRAFDMGIVEEIPYSWLIEHYMLKNTVEKLNVYK